MHSSSGGSGCDSCCAAACASFYLGFLCRDQDLPWLDEGCFFADSIHKNYIDMNESIYAAQKRRDKGRKMIPQAPVCLFAGNY